MVKSYLRKLFFLIVFSFLNTFSNPNTTFILKKKTLYFKSFLINNIEINVLEICISLSYCILVKIFQFC